MFQTLLAVLLGGVIGAIPTVISAVVSLKNSKADRIHQSQMKLIEIYAVAKRDALQDFMSNLGFISRTTVMTNPAMQAYLASAKKACMFVSTETASTIETISRFVIDSTTPDSKTVSLQYDSTVINLNDEISRELKSLLEGLEYPSEKRASRSKCH